MSQFYLKMKLPQKYKLLIICGVVLSTTLAQPLKRETDKITPKELIDIENVIARKARDLILCMSTHSGLGVCDDTLFPTGSNVQAYRQDFVNQFIHALYTPPYIGPPQQSYSYSNQNPYYFGTYEGNRLNDQLYLLQDVQTPTIRVQQQPEAPASISYRIEAPTISTSTFDGPLRYPITSDQTVIIQEYTDTDPSKNKPPSDENSASLKPVRTVHESEQDPKEINPKPVEPSPAAHKSKGEPKQDISKRGKPTIRTVQESEHERKEDIPKPIKPAPTVEESEHVKKEEIPKTIKTPTTVQESEHERKEDILKSIKPAGTVQESEQEQKDEILKPIKLAPTVQELEHGRKEDIPQSAPAVHKSEQKLTQNITKPVESPAPVHKSEHERKKDNSETVEPPPTVDK